MRPSNTLIPVHIVQTKMNLFLTLTLWLYFTVGFICFFAPFYLAAALFASQRERAFQKLNHRFYRIFFKIIRLFISTLTLQIEQRALAARIVNKAAVFFIGQGGDIFHAIATL